MYRCSLFSLIVLSSFAAGAWGQELNPSQPARRGLSLLYETAAGIRLNGGPGYGLYQSLETGPMIHLGDWSGGAMLMGIVDFEGANMSPSGRWGVRTRVRRWIGSDTHLDIGAGVLLGGASHGKYDYDFSHRQVLNWSYPGFTGLVRLGYGWVGINLQVHAIPATQYDVKYNCWESCRSPERGFTDWSVNFGVGVSGLPAVMVTAVEALALGLTAISVMSTY